VARGGRGVQYFTYGPFQFNVNKALVLAANPQKYRPEWRHPTPDWIGPLIDIDPAAVEHSDLAKPVLFATLVLDGAPWPVLIDGNHRVAKALRHQAAVKSVTLDLGDTLKVLSGDPHAIEQMRRDGRQLGLLPGPA
jgi:hypothetical protein